MQNGPLRLPRSLPLPALLGAIFGIVPMHLAQAATLLVTDCGDGVDSGTLRNTVAVAPDNSTIQIPLTCSTITIAGDIFIPNTISNMTIAGQGASVTTIDANRAGRAFYSFHTGGDLEFKDLTIANGYYSGAPVPLGGCIYGVGNVVISNAVVTACTIAPTASSTATPRGGGIFSLGAISVFNSTVSGNVAVGVETTSAQGGGLFAAGGIVVSYSTVSGNAVFSGASGPPTHGGGIVSAGRSVLILRSTISGNKADENSALHVTGSASYGVLIDASTITGNVATSFQTVGSYLPVHVTSSTIAFNRVASSNGSTPAGLYSSEQISMNDSIFAANTAKMGSANDVSSSAASSPLIGSTNLITATSNPVPLGTLSACPRLGHLSNNGGPTLTIPLLANSPALDAGTDDGDVFDQRGFSRPVGAGMDLGAYERQPGTIDDVIFYGAFESRCD